MVETIDEQLQAGLHYEFHSHPLERRWLCVHVIFKCNLTKWKTIVSREHLNRLIESGKTNPKKTT